MNSAKILLKTIPNHPQGYGVMFNDEELLSEPAIWAKMQEVIPKGGKYLKHFLHTKWAENKDYPLYELRKPGFSEMDIPCGDLSYWLTIFWEE